MQTKNCLFVVVLVLSLSTGVSEMALASPDAALSVTITPDAVSTSPETPLNFTVTLRTPTAYNGVAVDLMLTASWRVASQSTDPAGTYRTSSEQWVWVAGGTKQVNFSVIPEPTQTENPQILRVRGLGIDPSTNETVVAVDGASIVLGADQTPAAPPTVTVKASTDQPNEPAPDSTASGMNAPEDPNDDSLPSVPPTVLVVGSVSVVTLGAYVYLTD